MKKLLCLVFACAGLFFASCGDDKDDPIIPTPEDIVATQFNVAGVDNTIITAPAVGETYNFTISVSPAGASAEFTAKSSDETIAVVEGTIIKFLAAGKVTITWTCVSNTALVVSKTYEVISAEKKSIIGTWKIKSFEQTAATMQSDMWFDMITNWTGFPEKNDDDRITITADGKIQTNLKSTLKNYFQAESNYKVTNMDVTIHVGNSIANIVKPTILELDNVNRYFSDSETSEDKVAYLGVMPNEENNELLDVFIIDYETRSFAYPDFEDWFMYDAQKPVATGSGLYILFTMERAE